MSTPTARTGSRLHDFLALDGLPREDLTSLLDAAEAYVPIASGKSPGVDSLAGRIVANMFFEDSTRTRCSFTMAAKRLGGDTLEFAGSSSSLSKGETLGDTARNIEATGVDAIVVRAKPSGSAKLVAEAVACPVINAGDGRHEHPTQGLLDILTMRQRLGDLAGRRIAIVGDINASRVARSNLHGLTTLGAHVTLIGPPALAPSTFTQITDGPGTVHISNDLDEHIAGADVVMVLRVQFERGSGVSSDYHNLYGMTVERAARMKSGAIVMHPGPMNRGLEIDSAVADDPERSVILQQTTNGVAARMAVLSAVLAG